VTSESAVRIRPHLAPFLYLVGGLCAALPALFYTGALANGFPQAAYAGALIATFLGAGVALVAASLLAAFARPAAHHIARAASGLLTILLGFGVVMALLPTPGHVLWVRGFMYSLLLPFLYVVVVLAVAHRSVTVPRAHGSAT
jgi:hypothetical protein